MRESTPSENYLIIRSLDVAAGEEKSYGNSICLFKVSATLAATIEFRCRQTGNVFMEFDIYAYGKNSDANEAIKECIENFLNNRFEPRFSVHNSENYSYRTNNIDKLIILLEDPFKSLFEHLFNAANWKIPKELDEQIQTGTL